MSDQEPLGAIAQTLLYYGVTSDSALAAASAHTSSAPADDQAASEMETLE